MNTPTPLPLSEITPLSAPLKTILVVDDERDITELLGDILEDEGYFVYTADCAAVADQLYQRHAIDLVLLDIWMPDEDGLSLLTRWAQEKGGLRAAVLMMSGHGTIETAVQATKLGAFDFVEKPISVAKMLIAIQNAFKQVALQKTNTTLLNQLNPKVNLLGDSPLISQLKTQLNTLANSQMPVMFMGAAGSGKTFYARYLHQQSERRFSPFIAVNATALANHQQLGELFGNEEQSGLISAAESGSLFIDDALCLSVEAQAQLFQLLDEGHYKRLGVSDLVMPNVRLCFAIKQPLTDEQQQQAEHFCYQTGALHIDLPSLKSVIADLPQFVVAYVLELSEKEGLPVKHFLPEAQAYLAQHDWPGNWQELRNFIQRILLLTETTEIGLAEVSRLLSIGKSSIAESNNNIPIDLNLRDAREIFERDYLLKQFELCEGNVAKLAERAGMERTNLYRKLKSLGIHYR